MCPGFPSPYGAPAFASWASCSRQGIPPPSRLAYRHRAPDLTGFPRSACASSDRGGRPLDPEASGVHTAGENCPAAACRSSTARPCTPVLIPSAGALGNEASAGVHSRSPVRSSPRLRSRMERERFGFFPELRTPQLPAAHVRAGTGLEHWPGATSPTSSSALQSTSSLATCDLVSHVFRPVDPAEYVQLLPLLLPLVQGIVRAGLSRAGARALPNGRAQGHRHPIGRSRPRPPAGPGPGQGSDGSRLW